MFQPQDCKEFVEAERDEIALRDEPFIGVNPVVCGIEVKPLNMLLFNRLERISSPFVVGRKIPTVGDVAVFLWLVSPKFREQRGILSKFARWQFFRTLRRIDLGEAIAEIERYISLATYDAPRGTGGSKKSYSSWNAIIVHELASAYGWTLKEIEECPYAILFQLRGWISWDIQVEHWREGGPKPTRSNPSERKLREYVERHFNGAKN